MKRWGLSILLALLACVPVLLAHSTDQTLLKDTDTAFLLQTIREKQAPMSWFTGDWPLQNHFYRPLPTLTFELDTRLYGDNPNGYAWTNDLLCVFCVLSLFWFLLELSSSQAWAFVGTSIFSLWNIDRGEILSGPLFAVAGLTLLVGLYRHSFKFRHYVPAALVLCFLASEIATPQVSASKSLGISMIGWLPGRTASVMTLFALISMAAYVRYERARDEWAPLPPPTALDRPTATKSGAMAVPKQPTLWLVVCLLAAAAAFASYEQAVMLPAALLGTAVYLKLKGRLPNWRVHGLFWIMLGGYFALRHFVLPPGVSHYQAQQFRHGPGVWSDLGAYIFPNVTPLTFVWSAVTVSIWALMNTSQLAALLALCGTITTAIQARKNWQTILAGWALSSLAFLPMAWLNQFGHYHYWPLALRTIFILGVGKLAWDLVSIAASPPALQAPPRPCPAPGSLPHP